MKKKSRHVSRRTRRVASRSDSYQVGAMDFDDSHSAVGRLSNKNYESDIDHALRYTRRLFTLIGIWSRVVSNPTTIERFVSRLMLPISLSCMLIHVVLLVSHVVLEEANGSELILMMGPLSFQATCLLKQVSLFLHSRLIKECIKHMETDWRSIENENDRRIMMKNLKVGDDLTIVCSVGMYGGGLFYQAILPLCTRQSTNETVGAHAYAGADIFLDSRAGYNYEIIVCTVCISAFSLCTLVASTCNLAAILVTHACGQIELIMVKLKNLLSSDKRQNIGEDIIANRIAIIIRHHVRVLKFASHINKTLREICLLKVISSTVIICFVEYYCMTEWNKSGNIAMMNYVLMVVALSSDVYIYCYVAYNFEWYELPGKTGLALVMIIIVATYPPRLTGGSIIELSIHTFGTIMRTSLGYFSILRKLAE